MLRRICILITFPGLLLCAGCVKETYNMNKLSKRAHISPMLAVAAVKGDVAFSDLAEATDTVTFGEDNFVTLVFTREDVLDLRSSDFLPKKGVASYPSDPSKLLTGQGPGTENAYLGDWTSEIDPDTLDLGIDDVLNHFSGDILISEPSITLSYTNSFADPMEINFNAAGRRAGVETELGIAPFTLEHPADTLAPPVSAVYRIDNGNSNITEVISMPPGLIWFSGTAVLKVSSENAHNDLSADRRLSGTVEVKIPLKFRAHDLVFTDTTDNFLADVFKEGNDLNWDDFKLFRVDFDVKNGFPLGVSLNMSLLDSLTHQEISTISADDVLTAAPVDEAGKVTKTADSKTSLTFTEEFFSSINRSDRILIRFGLTTTGNGANDVKIYSDYRLDFKASLVLNPDFKFNL
jgi:hypothetical protein